MNEQEDFLKQYLLSAAREGDTILFELPARVLCDAAPDPAGFVAGTLVSWDRNTMTLQISMSKKGWRWITIPSRWVRGFPLRWNLAARRDLTGNSLVGK